MKKNINIRIDDYNIEMITNGKDVFDNIIICFHGFNGDKWGDAFSGLKNIAENSLVCSFDSCGHGDSEVTSEKMRLYLILKEIDIVIEYLKKNLLDKPIILVAVSYGAYRVMEYLIHYKPNIDKIIYINPAFKMLETIENVKDFEYAKLEENALVTMKKSKNKYISKAFLDDLYENNLYSQTYDIYYDMEIVVGDKDSLIPIEDTLKIADMYKCKITYVNDNHVFENKENWKIVLHLIEDKI